MANAPAKQTAAAQPQPEVAPVEPIAWNGWLGLGFVIVLFFVSQIVASLLLLLYGTAQHWSVTYTNNWLENSVTAQFFYVLLAEGLVLAGIYLFLKAHKQSWQVIGLRRPHWRDVGLGLVMWVAYFAVFSITLGLVSKLIPGFNADQQQQIGFSSVHGVVQLVLTYVSLAVLPPITEEIMVRGFLYGSLKKVLPLWPAVLLTSLLFASAHLPEGGSAGPLYVGALDTFILSLALIYLREKTKSLWAGITLHALKNGLAFATLFLFHLK